MAAAPDPTRSLEDIFGGVCACTSCDEQRRATLQEVVQLAVEDSRRATSHKIGTLFVIGDTAELLARSRPLVLDPLYGHPAEVLRLGNPAFRETVKELAQLDGAFIVSGEGTLVSAARFVDVDVQRPENFLPGLGTRHAAAASITGATRAIAVVVSQSWIVRVFAGGAPRAEIIPEASCCATRSCSGRPGTPSATPSSASPSRSRTAEVRRSRRPRRPRRRARRAARGAGTGTSTRRRGVRRTSGRPATP